MSLKALELDDLRSLDFDDVVERARSLSVRDRSAALGDALAALPAHLDVSERAKLLLFVQTLLAATPDGKLKPALVEPCARELANVLLSTSEAVEVKRAALDAIALLLLKANDLTADTDATLREAIAITTRSSDPEMSSFARRILDRHIGRDEDAITAAILGELIPELEYAAPVLLERFERGNPLVGTTPPNDLGFETGAVDSTRLELFRALVPYVQSALGILRTWQLYERERSKGEQAANLDALISENVRLRHTLQQIVDLLSRRDGPVVSANEVVEAIAAAADRASTTDDARPRA